MKQLAVITLILLAIVAALSLANKPADPVYVYVGTPQPTAPNLAFELLADMIQADDAAKTAEANAAILRAAVTGTASAESAMATETARQATAQAEQATRAAQAVRDAQSTAEAWTITGWTATADAANSTATSQAQAAYSTATMQAQATATTQALIITGLTVTADVARSTATAQIQATQDAFIAGSLKRTEERERMVNNLVALAPYLIGALVLAVIIWMITMLVPVLQERMRDRQADKNGRYPILVTSQGVALLPDRSLSSLVNLGPNAHSILDVDPLLQERVTARTQAVEIARTAQPGQSTPRITVEPAQTQALQTALQHALPEIAPWSLLSTWPGGKLALGVGEQGIIQMDPEGTAPHMLFAGTTGSGKTRYGLRPVIAEALADSWQVVIIDRGRPDLAVFDGHPNAHLVTIDEPAQVVTILTRAYREMLRRLRSLTAAGVSTWSRSSGSDPRVMIVIDEFSNLTDDADSPAERENLWRGARMLAAEGRKAGMVLAIALQDPTHKSMDLRIRRNATKIAFRVQDADASRVVLGTAGAETLPHHQFMTVIGGLMTGVAFAPSDEEIRAFLAARSVAMLPAPEWIEEPEAIPLNESTERVEKPVLSREQQIRDLHAQGLSSNEIQRQVYGFTGGAAYAAVRSVLASTTGSSSTFEAQIATQTP